MNLAEKLSAAIAKLEINSIFLAKANVEVMKHPGLIKPENTYIDLNETALWSVSPAGDMLMCNVLRVLKGLSKEDENSEPKEVFKFEVVLVVQYLLNDPEKTIESHTFEVFSKTNALYNSYPYFREYIHSNCNRMGMAPIVLSFMKPLTMKQIIEMFPDPIPSP